MSEKVYNSFGKGKSGEKKEDVSLLFNRIFKLNLRTN